MANEVASPRETEPVAAPEAKLDVTATVKDSSRKPGLFEYSVAVAILALLGKSFVAGSDTDRNYIREVIPKNTEAMVTLKESVDQQTEGSTQLQESLDDLTKEIDDFGDDHRAQAEALTKLLENATIEGAVPNSP